VFRVCSVRVIISVPITLNTTVVIPSAVDDLRGARNARGRITRRARHAASRRD